MTRHRLQTHPEYVEGCYGCRISSVQLSPTATPSRQRGDYGYQQNFAAEFHNGDREAYRRLRQDGLQPPRIAGSAHLERHAQTAYEVERGVIETDQRSLRTALSVCESSGLDPLKPALQEKGA